MAEHKSVLVLAKEAQARVVPIFEVNGFVGIAGPVLKIGVRVNVPTEQDRAVVTAHKYVQDVAAGIEAAKSDGDILDNAKTTHALFEACREVETREVNGKMVDVVTAYPAFTSPSWMRDNLTHDQQGALLNLYQRVKREQAPGDKEVSDETLEDIIEKCSDARNLDVVAAVLAQTPSYVMAEFVVALCEKLRASRAEAEAAQAQVDALLAATEFQDQSAEQPAEKS